MHTEAQTTQLRRQLKWDNFQWLGSKPGFGREVGRKMSAEKVKDSAQECGESRGKNDLENLAWGFVPARETAVSIWPSERYLVSCPISKWH